MRGPDIGDGVTHSRRPKEVPPPSASRQWRRSYPGRRSPGGVGGVKGQGGFLDEVNPASSLSLFASFLHYLSQWDIIQLLDKGSFDLKAARTDKINLNFRNNQPSYAVEIPSKEIIKKQNITFLFC